MRSDDVKLIQRILAGDENAFATLIEKYQRQVHALAFRKVRDFQTAEDITQETFLQVHQKLATLNDPAKFSGWLYAIVNHLCIAWYRKNRLQTEALQEIYISELLGVSENTIKSRLHRARQWLKQYESTIQEALDITTEAKYNSESQLKGETIMTDEMRDETKVEVNPEEMQRSLAEMQDKILEARRELAAVQAKLKIITAQSDASIDSGKREALEALFRLPHDAKDPITWCYAGAYRAASGQQSRRGSIWSDSIDNFISRAPDAEIVKLAKFFTNPTVVAVLRQLVEGKKSVADLANGCGISENEMEKTVALLIDGSLVDRTEDGLIEPKHDAVFYFFNFVGMTRVYLDPEDH